MDTRAIIRELYIEAPPEAVWRALTDAVELTRWFPLEARVEPGEGGSIWISWGEGAEGRAPIRVWEPGRHLGWREEYGPVQLAVDFHLRARGGTVLRLVHSGFSADADWDEQFHMTEGGWAWFMAHLRHYLERHAGEPRAVVYARQAVALPRPESYARLTGAGGLAATGSLGGLAEGDAYAVRTASGLELAGRVVVVQPDYQIGLSVDGPGDALLFLEVEPAPEGTRPALWLSTYGLGDAELDVLARELGATYARALSLEPEPAMVHRSG